MCALDQQSRIIHSMASMTGGHWTGEAETWSSPALSLQWRKQGQRCHDLPELAARLGLGLQSSELPHAGLAQKEAQLVPDAWLCSGPFPNSTTDLLSLLRVLTQERALCLGPRRLSRSLSDPSPQPPEQPCWPLDPTHRIALHCCMGSREPLLAGGLWAGASGAALP